MDQTVFKQALTEHISPGEWTLLAREDCSLTIGDFNRRALLRLRRWEPGRGSISDSEAARLHLSLQRYLNRYMADRPEGHKWIILASLFLRFGEGVPLHPQELTGWAAAPSEAGIGYVCPWHGGADSVCACCVCLPKE